MAKKQALLVNRDWVVFRHGGHGKRSKDPFLLSSGGQNVNDRRASATLSEPQQREPYTGAAAVKPILNARMRLRPNDGDEYGQKFHGRVKMPGGESVAFPEKAKPLVAFCRALALRITSGKYRIMLSARDDCARRPSIVYRKPGRARARTSQNGSCPHAVQAGNEGGMEGKRVRPSGAASAESADRASQGAGHDAGD